MLALERFLAMVDASNKEFRSWSFVRISIHLLIFCAVLYVVLSFFPTVTWEQVVAWMLIIPGAACIVVAAAGYCYAVLLSELPSASAEDAPDYVAIELPRRITQGMASLLVFILGLALYNHARLGISDRITIGLTASTLVLVMMQVIISLRQLNLQKEQKRILDDQETERHRKAKIRCWARVDVMKAPGNGHSDHIYKVYFKNVGERMAHEMTFQVLLDDTQSLTNVGDFPWRATEDVPHGLFDDDDDLAAATFTIYEVDLPDVLWVQQVRNLLTFTVAMKSRIDRAPYCRVLYADASKSDGDFAKLAPTLTYNE